MKALRYMLIFFTSIIALALFAMWYIGAFDTIDLEKRITEKQVVAGFNFRGSYQQIPAFISEADSLLNNIGINSPVAFGVYYNDPANTAEQNLESFVGKVIKPSDYSKLEEAKNIGLTVDTIPEGTALVASMPIRSQLSYMIGPVRAYPKLEQTVTDSSENVSLVYELYDVEAAIAYYIMLLQE